MKPIAAFQGNLNNKKYFEGWYFKQVSNDKNTVWSIIPGLALGDDSHAFIQLIDGLGGRSWYLRYELGDCYFSTSTLEVHIGKSQFTSRGIKLAIEHEEVQLHGELAYSSFTEWKSRLLSPGIMGWYSYIPRMECKHGVVSLQHRVSGAVELRTKENTETEILDFSNGYGYIEKDWGKSFPAAWLWLQCNTFTGANDVSFMLSVARIPWLGHSFTGNLGFFQFGKEQLGFGTWSGTRILDYSEPDAQSVALKLLANDFSFDIYAKADHGSILQAPRAGSMIIPIKESINASIQLRVSQNKKIIFEGEGVRAGMELVGGLSKFI